MGAQVRERQAAKDIQFRPQGLQQGGIALPHLAGGGPYAQNFAQHFGQGNNGARFGLARKRGRGFTVGQVQHAVQHAHRKGFAAHGADIAQFPRLARFQHHMAGPVAVQMVLALVGIKFHGAQEAAVLAALVLTPGDGPQGRKQARIGGPPRKEIGLAPQVSPGMGVGIGNERIAVQGADHAVHGRIGRKARFQGEDMFREVAVAVFQTVKAGFGAKQRKPRRPDVCGNHDPVGRAFQQDFQQVAGIQPQNGPTVRGQIADLRQPQGEAFCVLQAGHKDQVVDFAHLAQAFVDGTDFGLEQEKRPLPRAHILRQALQRLGRAPQPVQAAFRVRLQLFRQFGPPLGVGKIAGAQQVNALAARPGRQMPGRERLAGGP